MIFTYQLPRTLLMDTPAFRLWIDSYGIQSCPIPDGIIPAMCKVILYWQPLFLA